jgi:hypothetical protein
MEFELLAPFAKVVMVHNVKSDEFPGVVRFWKELESRFAGKTRVFAAQNGSANTFKGIGVLNLLDGLEDDEVFADADDDDEDEEEDDDVEVDFDGDDEDNGDDDHDDEDDEEDVEGDDDDEDNGDDDDEEDDDGDDSEDDYDR